MTNKASVWGMTERNFESHTLPEPFNEITTNNVAKNAFCLWNGASSPQVKTSRSVIKAVTYYCSDRVRSAGGKVTWSKLPMHLALGSVADGTEDKFFCELQESDPKKGEGNLQCITYCPSTGMLYACEQDGLGMKEYQTHKNALTHDGTAIWLCLLPYMEIKSPYIAEKLTELTNYFTLLETMHYKNPETQKKVYEEVVAALCYCIYKSVTDEAEVKVPILCEELREADGSPFENYQFLMDLSEGPQTGKNITGTFQVLGVSSDEEESIAPASLHLPVITAAFSKPESEFTAEERALIPKVKEGTVLTEEFVNILNEFNETFHEEDRNLQVTQFLIKGGTGVGKSTITRQFAALTKRPYVTFQFSANTTEDDLKGILIPYTEEGENSLLSESEKAVMEAIKNSDESTILDDVAVALALPTTFDCQLDPEDAFRAITGRSVKGVSYAEAYEALSGKVFSKAVEIRGRSNVSDSCVKYKYIPSNVIRAIQNGWVIELQEVNAVNQQSVLHCMFDVLEKSSIGVISTINGDVYRHPDFICFATMNEGYAGTHELNDAFANRFDYIEDMGSLSMERVERLVYESGIFGTSRKDCKMVADVHDKIMEWVREQGFNKEVSIRNILHFAKRIRDGKDPVFCCEHYLLQHIVSKTDPENYSLLWNNIKDCKIFKKK